MPAIGCECLESLDWSKDNVGGTCPDIYAYRIFPCVRRFVSHGPDALSGTTRSFY